MTFSRVGLLIAKTANNSEKTINEHLINNKCDIYQLNLLECVNISFTSSTILEHILITLSGNVSDTYEASCVLLTRYSSG